MPLIASAWNNYIFWIFHDGRCLKKMIKILIGRTIIFFGSVQTGCYFEIYFCIWSRRSDFHRLKKKESFLVILSINSIKNSHCSSKFQFNNPKIAPHVWVFVYRQPILEIVIFVFCLLRLMDWIGFEMNHDFRWNCIICDMRTESNLILSLWIKFKKNIPWIVYRFDIFHIVFTINSSRGMHSTHKRRQFIDTSEPKLNVFSSHN